EAAGLEAFAGRLLDGETAGHAEMHDESLAARELGEEIFGAPRERVHRHTFEAFRKTGRKGKAQILAAQLDAREAHTFQDRREPAPDGFALGKLRHGVD